MSVREAASRVGVQVYHTGQGQDERARRRFPHLLRGLDSAWSGASTHTGSRERGGGLRQTLDRQHLQQRRLTVGREDAPGTVWATPLEHRFAALAMDFAALSTPNGT
jgi:hypothetical protein